LYRRRSDPVFNRVCAPVNRWGVARKCPLLSRRVFFKLKTQIKNFLIPHTPFIFLFPWFHWSSKLKIHRPLLLSFGLRGFSACRGGGPLLRYHRMNVVIVGTGYVGLVSGLGYAKLGHRVACVDKDAGRIANLDLGRPPFFEPGLSKLLGEMQEAGHIVFTTDLSNVISGADVVMLAVGTPAKASGEADLSAVFAAAEEIGKVLEHEIVVVTKSTVPVGTNRLLLKKVRSAMRDAGRDDLTELVNIASLP